MKTSKNFGSPSGNYRTTGKRDRTLNERRSRAATRVALRTHLDR